MPRLVAGAAIVFLVLQVVLPLFLLVVRGGTIGGESTPSGELPFSWQMYTVVPPPGELVLRFSDGGATALDAHEALGALGSRLAYDADFLRTACALDTDVVSVTIDFAGMERAARC